MSGIAIVTMVCTLAIIWGGLIGSIVALRVLPGPAAGDVEPSGVEAE